MSGSNGSHVKSDWLDPGPNNTGVYLLDWPCTNRDGGDGKGKIQDEYCEWDRSPVQDGTLQCLFRATFDKQRSHWLPERYGKDPDFINTKSNTYAALVKLVSDCTSDPNNHVDIDRVDPDNHRKATSGKVVGDVDRISDPTICRFLHDYTFVYHRKITPIPLPTPSSSQPGNAGVQLAVRSDLPAGCRFDADPVLKAGVFKTSSADAVAKFAADEATYVTCTLPNQSANASCDDLAAQLRVGIKLKVEVPN